MSAYRKWITRILTAALVAAVGVAGLALFADKVLGREVVLIAPHDAGSIDLQRALWMAGDPVAEIYGNPLGEPVRVVVTDPARIIRPLEDPSLSLLSAGSSTERRPLQVRTVWFLARPLIAMFLAIAALATALRFTPIRRKRKEITT
ncbi:MAG: hypothetical protein LC732_08385 [Acidobacteria bacterium]|nr:hypothetical protein [Acidobacteriota bacterium]